MVRKSVKIEGVSSIGISSTQMNSPTEVQPVWEDDDGDDDDDDGDGGDDDIYIMMSVCLSVCLSVTKNHHFLLGVSCDHLNPP